MYLMIESMINMGKYELTCFLLSVLTFEQGKWHTAIDHELFELPLDFAKVPTLICSQDPLGLGTRWRHFYACLCQSLPSAWLVNYTVGWIRRVYIELSNFFQNFQPEHSVRILQIKAHKTFHITKLEKPSKGIIKKVSSCWHTAPLSAILNKIYPLTKIILKICERMS